MHGEDYISLGFLFGEKSRVAYISDVSRFPASTEHGMFYISFFLLGHMHLAIRFLRYKESIIYLFYHIFC